MGLTSGFRRILATRILGGSLTLALALFFLVRENAVLEEGLNLHLAIDSRLAWVAVILLGLTGLAMLADGFFQIFNSQ
jgi:hypothetical protein